MRFATSGNAPEGVAADALGGVWVSGEFTGTASFGDYGDLTMEETEYGAFLLRLAPQ
jgi:hypothetical protein